MHKRLDENKQSTATVLVKHQVSPEKHQAFELWLKKISKAAQRYSGYLGTETMRSIETSDHNYVSIFRFDTYKNLETWIVSNDRRRLINELNDLISTPPSFSGYRGLEMWLPSSIETTKTPSRHKMAVLTFFSIWVLVHVMMNYVHPVIPGTPLVREILVVAIIVLVMTYAVMPMLVKLLSNWLCK